MDTDNIISLWVIALLSGALMIALYGWARTPITDKRDWSEE